MGGGVVCSRLILQLTPVVPRSLGWPSRSRAGPSRPRWRTCRSARWGGQATSPLDTPSQTSSSQKSRSVFCVSLMVCGSFLCVASALPSFIRRCGGVWLVCGASAQRLRLCSLARILFDTPQSAHTRTHTHARTCTAALAHTPRALWLQVKLGLDQCKFAFTGAAPISFETLSYWGSLGLQINEVYGMSENTGGGTWSKNDTHVWGSCGSVLFSSFHRSLSLVPSLFLSHSH